MAQRKENPSSFYARLVELPAGAQQWSRPQQEAVQTETQPALPAPAPAPAPVRYTGFRSAGVYDMSTYSFTPTATTATATAPPSSSSATGDGPGPPRTFTTLPARANPSAPDDQDGPSHNHMDRRDARLTAAEAALENQLKAGRATTAAASGRAAPRLTPDNIGYKLLKAAGWSEGRGLGREEQGPVAPVAATRNPGAQGIGFQKPQHKHVVILSAAKAESGADGTGAQVAGPAVVVRRVDIKQLVEQELAAETTDQKVARHRAVMRAEEEVKRNREMTRALYRAFDDPFDNVGASTANTNPLGKKTRLTATNPLLASDDEDG